MRRMMALVVGLMVIATVALPAQRGEGQTGFQLQIKGNLLFPADENYADVYGSTVIFPGVQAGYFLSDTLMVWAGYGYLHRSGTTPVLEENATSTQHLLKLGAGYKWGISDNLGFTVQAGIFHVSYSEEALGEEVSDSAIGLTLEGSLNLAFSRTLFGLVFLGYDYATDEVNGTDIKLGGITAGAGLGIAF